MLFLVNRDSANIKCELYYLAALGQAGLYSLPKDFFYTKVNTNEKIDCLHPLCRLRQQTRG